MFSPYYAWSGRGDPANHVALNVALYGPRGNRWAMTERGSEALTRDATMLRLGPSQLRWDGDALVIDIDEITAPLPSRLRGQVRVYPEALVEQSFALDPQARHHWRPIAPRSRIEVALDRPGLRWTGTGYLDSNHGSEPLEDGFVNWDWSRAHLQHETAVLYDGARRDGSNFSLALRIAHDGTVSEVAAPPVSLLPTSAWRIARATRTDAGFTARVVRTWEDSPFYVRSALRTRLFDESCNAVHESLSLDRFRSPVVRLMLPFRMPRRIFEA